MLGALIMVVVMVLVVPVAIMFGGAVWSALFGWIASEDADRRHQGDPA
jgi:membrane glycosyltransferase